MESALVINNFKTPPPLKQGDTIGICAPSGAFDVSRFNIGVDVLKSMGFNIHIPDAIYQQKRYMAGDDRVRSNVINSLFENRDIKGIICARGGFGSLRTLDYIDYDLIAANPKLFVGFSDITALLIAIYEISNLQVVHGPVVTSLADTNESTLKSLYDQLTSSCYADLNNPFSKDFNSSNQNFCSKYRTLRKGYASGRLTGGNLTTLCHLIGTRFQPNFDDSILFLEDVGEPPYKIDRMLTQMKLTGMLKKVKGVIVGSISPATSVIDEIILEIFDNPAQPIILGFDSGHGRTNLSLRFASTVEISF